MTDEDTDRILEQIAREELLIQEYEQELRELHALSESQPLESDLMDDSLRMILHSIPHADINSSLVQSLTDEAPHNIQQAIRGFCFTKAVHQSRDIHILKGHFMTDISWRFQHSFRKMFLDHETHAWMNQHVSNDNLPFWIEGISNYLQFDKKRTEFLSNNKFEFERKESRVRIQLSDFLTVYWDWKWKRGEDTLRLPTSLPPSTIIRPQKLEALVQVCKGNCIEALKLLRQTLTTTDHQLSSSLHDGIGSGEDSSDSDSFSASPRPELKTPPVKVKKRGRKRGYADAVGSTEDSSASGSMLASLNKPRSKTPLVQTQMKKRDRKDEYSHDLGSVDDLNEGDSKTPHVQTPMKKRRRKSGYLDIVMAKRKKR